MQIECILYCKIVELVIIKSTADQALGKLMWSQTSRRFCSDLTHKEQLQIAKLPIFRSSTSQQNTSIANNQGFEFKTATAESYKKYKTGLVFQIFGEDHDYPTHIAYTLPQNLRQPFRDVYARAEKPRLSVTKLLTKQWCELRFAYDLYARLPIFDTRHLDAGKAAHQNLEESTHEIAPWDYDILQDHVSRSVPSAAEEELMNQWYNSIVRLIHLFRFREAREILCHGYLNLSKGEFVSDPKLPLAEDSVLVSGVVDHLTLEYNDSQCFMNDEIAIGFDDKSLTLGEQVRSMENSISSLKKQFHINVSDVKTRSRRSVPNQANVMRTSKLQVMYYKELLNQLGCGTAQSAYNKLIMNAERRGVDVDKPIDPIYMTLLLFNDVTFADDFVKVCVEGGPIGFAPYDNSRTSTCDVDLTGFPTSALKFVPEHMAKVYCAWKAPVTLRYFAARLSQMYGLVGPLLSDNLALEYYHDEELFQRVEFQHDGDALRDHLRSSSDFWAGNRDIEPIYATPANFRTYCRFCDYQEVCAWKRKGEDSKRALGAALMHIIRERAACPAGS